ncbi:unnamed protein product [Microthlaspi erraticum]|uniref:Uncharacterized protein n=1 Tax=Microthlaspi erraticum TaxID=1685480 RepID=A0A6D2IU31_9BRAS|nr:unnamed protein product [Microthlaspi erraticum]
MNPNGNNNNGHGGPQIPVDLDSKDHIFSLVRQGRQLIPQEVRTLITRRYLRVTPAVPSCPPPPAIFLLPSDQAENILHGVGDGYTWYMTSRVEAFKIGDETETALVTRFSLHRVSRERDICRRMYILLDRPSLVLVHYTSHILGRKEEVKPKIDQAYSLGREEVAKTKID